MNATLPEGWDIERVRELSGDAGAALIPLERLVVAEEFGATDYEVLRPDLIISFHGLCLARVDGEWFMGELDTDGSLICWSSCGDDLARAIRAL